MSTTSGPAPELLQALEGHCSTRQRQIVAAAIELAARAHHGQKRGTGEPYLHHSLAVALIVSRWHLDLPTILAAILHDVPEDTETTLDQLTEAFGPEVTGLVDSVTKLSVVRVPREEIDYEVENLRRLFLAMSGDIRVVLLKLADRLHNMRTIAGVPASKRRRIARETLEIYAPLADRLGMGEVRSELDDLGFRYAEPKEYDWTKRQVEASHEQRTRFIGQVRRRIERVLAAEGIPCQISARTKNFYSLHRKLIQKDRDVSQIYDLFAIRVIVDTVAQCYQGIGVIHRHWQPLPQRIKDYIAVPKLNGYRSLHTTIFGPGKRLLEVQLRTKAMHQEAELGIAAHAVYAEQKMATRATREQLAVMKQLVSWRDELRESSDVLSKFKLDLFVNRIFAFTPKGALYSLPAGATPVDFAYNVHTEIGQTCHGAKVNGVITSLDTPLTNGDVVEILTRRGGTPKRDWLNFVRTGHARSHIRSFLRKQGDAGIRPAPGKPVAIDPDLSPKPRPQRRPVTKKQLRPLRVGLSGMSSLLTKRSKCCAPQPPAEIVGYVTAGKGISIHRRSCRQVAHLPDPTRIIEVSWS